MNLHPAAHAPTAPRDRYAVIGNPIAHSRSPAIHAAFAQSTGTALHYGRLLSPLDGFEATVRAFAAGQLHAEAEPAADGGDTPCANGSPAHGCNVTVPFKFEALRLAPRRTERAALAEAANTLRFDAEGWIADNTDGAGLMRDIVHNLAQPLAGTRVLLIGAGGAAAGVIGPLLQAGVQALVVANRSVDKAERLVERHAALARQCGAVLRAAPLSDAGTGHDLVINASASSLAGAAVPVAASVLRPGALAIDLMYGAAAQPFLDWAAQHGARGSDGLGMLVEQAAEAFAFWRGVRPDTRAVLAALRAAVPVR